jgi:Holliday junction resolvase RusA-like endonuclease
MPPGINESRAVVRGRIITTAIGRRWKDEAQWQVSLQRLGVTLPYRFACLILLPANRRYDIDAGIKLLLDACQAGGAVTNDKHCRDLHVMFDETRDDDSVLIELTALPDAPPQKRKASKKPVANLATLS